MLDLFLFTVGYVSILLVVSFVYYRMGYHRGVQDALLSIRQFDPKALDKALDKMRKEVDGIFDKNQ